MAYIGNQSTNSFSSIPAKQDLTGASGTSLTLTHAVASAEGIDLFINNVRQEPTTAYSVTGTAVTLTGSVVATDDIYVVYNSLALQTTVPPDGSVSTAKIADGAVTTAKLAGGGTGAFTVPVGTTAQRPASPSDGMIRRNSTNKDMEFYNGTEWVAFSQQTAGIYFIDYIVVGGGGGSGSGTTGSGARNNGGGGGGGVFLLARQA